MKIENLCKKIMVGLMVSIFITGTTISQVSAKEIELEQKTNIPIDKVWTVRMTQMISSEGISSKVLVKDSAGTVVSTNVTVGADGKTVVVSPKTAYEDGKTYTLSILEGITSKDKQNALKDTVSMNFTVSKNATNPVSEIDNNSLVGVYLNGVKVAFPATLQPKIIEGVPYLPLEVMTKVMKFDTKISMIVKPNITVTIPTGKVTTDFKGSGIATPTDITNMSGKVSAVADSTGKYIGSYVPLDFFEVGLGFKLNYKVAKAEGTATNLTHVITLDGTLGTGGTVGDGGTGTGGNPADYVITPNTPSITKYPTTMENLQAIVKLIPEGDIMTNDSNFFRYDTAEFAVTSKNNISFQTIMVQGQMSKNPIGAKVVKSILADIVGGTDATEMYSALLTYNATFFVEGNTDSITSKYLGYRLTTSKGHQYQIRHDGDQSYLDIK